MGFHGINEENRQYVCLSQSANSILENDMLAFQITNRSTIINIIIDNFMMKQNPLSLCHVNDIEKDCAKLFLIPI